MRILDGSFGRNRKASVVAKRFRGFRIQISTGWLSSSRIVPAQMTSFRVVDEVKEQKQRVIQWQQDVQSTSILGGLVGGALGKALGGNLGGLVGALAGSDSSKRVDREATIPYEFTAEYLIDVTLIDGRRFLANVSPNEYNTLLTVLRKKNPRALCRMGG